MLMSMMVIMMIMLLMAAMMTTTMLMVTLAKTSMISLGRKVIQAFAGLLNSHPV